MAQLQHYVNKKFIQPRPIMIVERPRYARSSVKRETFNVPRNPLSEYDVRESCHKENKLHTYYEIPWIRFKSTKLLMRRFVNYCKKVLQAWLTSRSCVNDPLPPTSYQISMKMIQVLMIYPPRLEKGMRRWTDKNYTFVMGNDKFSIPRSSLKG